MASVITRSDPQPHDVALIIRLICAIERRDQLSPEERDALAATISTVRSVPAGTVLVRAHTVVSESTLLLEGLVARQYDLQTGKREITALHVPGDFLDLHSLTLKQLDHDVVALTPVRVASAPHGRLRALTETHPHLTRLLWFLTTVDAAIHRQWIAVKGQAAAGRIAHLISEIHMRLELVGLADEQGFAMPLTQMDLADMTGLTSVHVNRTLRKLREAKLLEFRDGRVTIANIHDLRGFAEFDPSYLYAKREAS
jgi:CRP-like cAMP-binding protein